MGGFVQRFTEWGWEIKLAAIALVLLVTVLFGMIFLQLLGYTVQALGRRTAVAGSRKDGALMLAGGAASWLGGFAAYYLPTWIPGLHANYRIVPLGLFATGLYLVCEGVGLLVFARYRVGVIAFIWTAIFGLGWVAFR